MFIKSSRKKKREGTQTDKGQDVLEERLRWEDEEERREKERKLIRNVAGFPVVELI